jgi:S-adenosylmethionine:tRNA ribosyltransferase-isomerase
VNDYISISDYSYELPEEKIARYPLRKRDTSKLLVFRDGLITENRFNFLSSYLPEKSILFFNNTKVIHARLLFTRSTGASVEIFCISPADPQDYQAAFSSEKTVTWLCMVGNLKKWKQDSLSMTVRCRNRKVILVAEKISRLDDGVIVSFSWDDDISFGEIIDAAGRMPIPPYLNRPPEAIDEERYQTVYSKYDGSVAAPTAGLHFTPAVINEIRDKGISIHEITLHVGAGTFQPVKSENAMVHKMHRELFSVELSTINLLGKAEFAVIATGTTTLRTLESLYWLAVKSVRSGKVENSLEQWEYSQIQKEPPRTEVFRSFYDLLIRHNLGHYKAYTGIMIVPGYKFKVVDALITNYHQPKSTLLLLVAAFIGKGWKKVYDYALENDFRFLSYGDSSLLWRKNIH